MAALRRVRFVMKDGHIYKRPIAQCSGTTPGSLGPEASTPLPARRRDTGLRVTGLHIYPVKSCAGIALTESAVGRMGLRYDRQWVFVDEHGMFVAQRESRGLGIPVRHDVPDRDGDRRWHAHPDRARHAAAARAGRLASTDRTCRCASGTATPAVVDQGADAGAWATEVLSRERPGRYRLVRMPDRTHRRSKIGDGEVAYGDAYPFLVISEESLADLNARLADPCR